MIIGSREDVANVS